MAVTLTHSIVVFGFTVLVGSCYNITPECDATSSPCTTLDQFSVENDTSNVTLRFLPGDHSLSKEIKISNIDRVSIVGTSPCNIVCKSIDSANLKFETVNYVEISNIAITSCGNMQSTGGALHFESVKQFVLSNVTLHENLNTSLSIHDSNGFVREARIIKNSGTGIVISNSTVQFNGSNSFSDNIDGGITSLHSELVFSGMNKFSNNKAIAGGGFFASRSSIDFYGSIFLTGNSAVEGRGGAFYARDVCKVNFNGHVSFVNNSAKQGGGGIAAWNNTTVNLNGTSIFTSNTAQGSGGGVLAESNSVVDISGETSFINNMAVDDGGGIFLQSNSIANVMGTSLFQGNIAKDNGGGIDARLSSTLNINGNSNFIDNSALDEHGGGIFSWLNSTVNINTDSNFFNTGTINFITNSANFDGGGIVAWDTSTININGLSRFINNSAYNNGGGIYLLSQSSLNVDGYIDLYGNFADLGGGGICAVKNCSAILSGETNFTSNWCGYHGGGVRVYQSSFSLLGNSIFVNNSATYGGALYSYFGTVTFGGNGIVTENSATINGGALSLAGASKVYFAFNSYYQFLSNAARQYGGAIFIDDNYQVYCTADESGDSNDQIEYINVECSSNSSSWIVQRYTDLCLITPVEQNEKYFSVILSNNTAIAGSVLYGGEIDRTATNIRIITNNTVRVVTTGALFDAVAYINDTSTLSDISSDPYHVCQCFNGQPNCKFPQSPYKVTLYPGQTISISVVAVGQRNGTVLTTVSSDGAVLLNDLERTQKTDVMCTELSYTIHSLESRENFNLFAEGPCGIAGIPLSVEVTLHDCPTGFMLSNMTLQCECETRLQSFTDMCHINNQTITRTESNPFWIGIGQIKELILHKRCPFDYCVTHSISFMLNDSDRQCNLNRSGLLCGKCQPGLSLAFGSSQCLECSNSYLSLLIVFVVAGVALVVLLLVVNLTVAVGTVNGLIFYANIIVVNRAYLFPSGETNLLTVFISWVNLDLGIETCFFDGMDAYTKAWLQFVFPAYMCLLVVIVIIASHYSMKISRRLGTNPVAVLATLLLLSYAKLLRTIITAFSFTFLEYPNDSKVVWVHDGNIAFLQGKHIPLFIAALLSLLLLFIPFTLLLLLAQWIQSHSEYRVFSWISDYRIKSFLDVYQGPFRTKHRYWFGLLLVVRCCLFLIFAFNAERNTSVNLLAIALFMFVLEFMLSWIKVYKNWYLNALDTSFILNLEVLAVGTFYVQLTGGNQTALSNTSVGIAFITFCVIVVYHIYVQVKTTRFWNKVMKKYKNEIPENSNLQDSLFDDSADGLKKKNFIARWKDSFIKSDKHSETIDLYERSITAPTTMVVSID